MSWDGHFILYWWSQLFYFSGPDRGPDRDILILKYFYLGLTKTSFFSNSLTERARQV
jgi:hypothetical protein